jgi:hypothetical protein
MAVDVARAVVRQVVSYQSSNVDGTGSTEAGVVLLVQQHEIYLTFSKTKNGNRWKVILKGDAKRDVYMEN